MKVQKGKKVKGEYEGKLESGEVFDSSEKHGKPLEFVAGEGQMIKGFDEAVLSMQVGEERVITLQPNQAYGPLNADLHRTVPRDQLPKDQEPTVGGMLVIGTPEGQQFPAKISKVTDTEVTLDLNHPLAGKTLIFKIKVVGIE